MLGEIAFARWFTKTYEGDKIHKQNAERDFQGIDFADEKGFTYQIKATASKTYTFNCVLDDLNSHLKANWYVCIQIHETTAYIEAIFDRKEILMKQDKVINMMELVLYGQKIFYNIS